MSQWQPQQYDPGQQPAAPYPYGYYPPPPQYAPPPPQYTPPPPAAAPAPAAAASAVDPITALTQLKALLDSGVLTQEEFDAQKQRVLQGS